MVEAAEREGKIKPGGTIVEPTSGNTGVGLAMVAQAKGYTCVFVCPDKVSEDKRNVLTAYGAQVVVCPPPSSQNTQTPAARCPIGWSARSRGPGNPTNTATRTIQPATTRPQVQR